MAHKKISYVLPLCTTLLGTHSLAAQTYIQPYCATPTHLSVRSQGEHIARLNAGLTNYLTRTVTDAHYGAASLTPAYSRSFKPTPIAACLFGNLLQTDRTLTLAGSQADPAANNTNDIRAEWLYLPRTYRGSMRVTPRIHNVTTDIDLYWSMDKWFEGLFARLVIPITHTSWDLGVCSVVEQRGEQTVNNITYVGDQLDYWCHKDALGGTLPCPVDPLAYARICPCTNTKNGVADLHLDLGWKLLVDDNFHLGFFLRTVAPTGTCANGQLLFAPVIGNGHHWELGGGLSSNCLMWSNEDREDRLGFYIELYATHLFSTKECRVFDLKNKPLSRYMIATQVTPDDATPQRLAPVANITASRVNVKINAQADLALWLDYTHRNISCDLGYNFWARSCERICVPKECTEESWGIWNYGGTSTATKATIISLGSADATPVLITVSDFDLRASATRGMSQTLFAHIAYNWFDNMNVPYVGIGGSVEWARSGGCKPSSDCRYHTQSCVACCRQCALSQWSLWTKAGLSF